RGARSRAVVRAVHADARFRIRRLRSRRRQRPRHRARAVLSSRGEAGRRRDASAHGGVCAPPNTRHVPFLDLTRRFAMRITARSIATPVGEMLALLDEEGALVALPFADGPSLDDLARRDAGPEADIEWQPNAGENVARQLEEYFDGRRRTFELKLRPRGT